MRPAYAKVWAMREANLLPLTVLLAVVGLAACTEEGQPDAGAQDAATGGDAGARDTGGSGDSGGLTPDSGTTNPDAAAGDAGANPDAAAGDAFVPPIGEPPVTRGGMFLGFPERFNRAYTDPTWMESRTIYVSADGTGAGTRASPAAASDAPSYATPGTRIVFLAGTYANFCIELGDSESGTYDQPVVLEAERSGGGYDVHLDCCGSGRATCINLENASYVAVRGFEMQGGSYGVRAVGSGYEASNHSRGIATLDCHIYGQQRDPILTGASDWDVWQGNTCHDGGPGDGHGIYLSNGSDWNIVRNNELYSNMSADFQINADPASCCADVGIPFDDPRCDDYAGTGEGGQGVSDYMLVENNFFHHGNAQGANFTSVRRSVVRNNIFAIYARHGVSFWQETDNPRLGSSENQVHHNLFVASNQRQMLQFVVNSTRNDVRNNLFVGVSINGGTVSASANAVWMETDATVADNVYAGNYYIAGRFDGDAPHTPTASETTRPDLDPAWFEAFPAALAHDPHGFRGSAGAPFLGSAPRLPEVGLDREGGARSDPTDPGPFEVR